MTGKLCSLQTRPARVILAVIAAALALSILPARADVPTSYEEQYKLMRAPNAVATFGADLFGDSVNLYNGALEFRHTDVSLPGNNPLPVSIGRRISAGDYRLDGRAFGKWELDIPHIYLTVPHSTGWVNSAGAAARCSSFSQPAHAIGSSGSDWDPTEFWQGTFLYVPGAGAQQMLSRSADNSAAPGAPRDYPVVTARFWNIACLASVKGDTAAGSAGEGFVATAPDGTRYYFDWVARFGARAMFKSEKASMPSYAKAPSPPDADAPAVTPNSFSLARDELWLMPSKLVDRFGNTVAYTYDPARPRNLLRIDASDGRAITLTYQTDAYGNDQVATVSDGTRSWRYSYHATADNPRSVINLDKVTLPDGSAWKFTNFDGLLNPVKLLNNGGCSARPLVSSASFSGSISHPSGASASFTIAPVIHGRSHVPEVCNIYAGSEALVVPRYFATLSLSSKTISGPGLTPLAWTYDYGPPNDSWDTCPACVTSKTVTVTNPASEMSRYTYGNEHNVNEGRLELSETGWNGSAALSSVAQHYAPFGAGPYPRQMGAANDGYTGDSELDARLAPLERRVTTQQGVTFTWQANAFDSFARPVNVTRSSSLGMARTEATEFADNLPKWVLGQLRQVTEAGSGRVMVQNAYHPATATLTSISHFGHPDQSMTYFSDGTVATRTDGLGRSTSYSNYRRGIPQNITYPNATAESAVVSNIGTITSLTNAAGTTTSFGYDAMGRLASIGYPAADSVAWNPTTIAFYQSSTAAFDLPAGHWRQQIKAGAGATVHYYDALWRPRYTERWDDSDVAGSMRIVRHQYDFAGRTTFEAYPKHSYGQLGSGVHTSYDALGRAIRSTSDSELGALTATTTYEDGYRKNHIDARGHGTITGYQVFDEPVDNAIASIAAPEGVNVAIARDLFGKPTAITRSGAGVSATRRYVYDSFQRLCKTIEPETGATVQDYDAANNVGWRASGMSLPSTSSCDTASVASAKKISFAYDTLNRLTATSYGDGSPAISRSYTPDGLPDIITSNGIVWTNRYNKRRLNERESMTYGGATYNVDRAYDANGSLRLLTYPDSTSLDYAPNALGEPTRAGKFASAVTYHPNGAIASFTYGNGIVHTLAQNARGLPELSSDAGILADKYAYDENANVKAIGDQQEGISTRVLSYDNLDRLTGTTAAATFGVVANTYDALDNLTKVVVSQGPTARTTIHAVEPATNRLKNISSATSAYNLLYGYDDQGNITARGSQGFVFDQGNRLKSAIGKATYGYDGLGHRASTVGTDGVNRISVYTQGGQLLYLRATSAPLAAGTKYIYLGRHQIAEVKAAGAQP